MENQYRLELSNPLAETENEIEDHEKAEAAGEKAVPGQPSEKKSS